jgi:hypothetical protein
MINKKVILHWPDVPAMPLAERWRVGVYEKDIKPLPFAPALQYAETDLN